MEARKLEFEARFLLGPGRSADLEMKVSLGFHVVGKVVKELPRERCLKFHPGWWYFQENYCFRTRKMDQGVLDRCTPMQKDIKMENRSRCLM